jgi:hypothetical protein
MFVFGLLGLALVVYAAVWVRNDAIKRGMSHRWGTGVFWVAIVFFHLYFAVRKPMRCPICGNTVESLSVCGQCDPEMSLSASEAGEAAGRSGRIFG